MPVLWVEMAVAARLRRYPMLDLRTSHFLLVSSLVVAAVGVFGILDTISRWNRAVALAAGVGLAASFAVGSAPRLGDLHIVHEDVRAPTFYVAAHRTPNDVIVVNSPGNFGFSYYWPHGTIATTYSDSGQGFHTLVPGLGALYVPTDDYGAVVATLREALARSHAAGPRSRVFIVRSHLAASKAEVWTRAFAALGLRPRSIPVGTEPLLVIGPA